MKRTNYFYIYTKKDSIRIESVYGTDPERTERLIEAGWSLIGVYNENKIQFMVAGKVTSVLDKSFDCTKEISQEKTYEEKLSKGTKVKIKINIEIDDFNKLEFDEILSQYAMCSRKFYLDVAREIKNKLL